MRYQLKSKLKSRLNALEDMVTAQVVVAEVVAAAVDAVSVRDQAPDAALVALALAHAVNLVTAAVAAAAVVNSECLPVVAAMAAVIKVVEAPAIVMTISFPA